MPMQIGKMYHIAHVVTDLEAAAQWYRDVFDAEELYRGFDGRAMRDACLFVFADMMIEPMAPAKVPGSEEKNTYKFYERFGERVYGVAWYTGDIRPVFDELNNLGVRQYGVSGELLTNTVGHTAIFTHPRDTPGLLEFAVPGYIEDPRLSPDWELSRWRDDHPLGLERTSHISLVVNDCIARKELFLGLSARLIREDQTRDRRAMMFEFGEGPAIELIEPFDSGTAEGQCLEQYGEGFFQVVYKTRNVDRAASYLENKGFELDRSRPQRAVLHSGDSFNVRIGFTELTPEARV
jgi:catechol 2,3-dioxygenase-like lactoylglutathione lyase family enzyme